MPNQLLPKEFLDKYAETENWFTYEKVLDQLAEHKGFETYVEVGVWKGHSTRYFVKKLQEANKEFSYFAIDLWDKLPLNNELWISHPDQMPYLRHIYNYNLINSGTRKDVFDMIVDSAEGATKFKDGSVDCLFLDASHDKPSVKRDLEAWWSKISDGGVMAGHDVLNLDTFEAVRDFFEEKKVNVEANAETNVWVVVKGLRIK